VYGYWQPPAREERVSAKFIEFLGASGGMVYINADTIDAISVGSPHRLLSRAGGWSSGPLW